MPDDTSLPTTVGEQPKSVDPRLVYGGVLFCAAVLAWALWALAFSAQHQRPVNSESLGGAHERPPADFPLSPAATPMPHFSSAPLGGLLFVTPKTRLTARPTASPTYRPTEPPKNPKPRFDDAIAYVPRATADGSRGPSPVSRATSRPTPGDIVEAVDVGSAPVHRGPQPDNPDEVGYVDTPSCSGAPGVKCQLNAGSKIHCRMIDRLDSTLPGVITALVTQDVRDSQTGRVLLVPAGTKVFGSYTSSSSQDQARMATVWQRLYFADGSEYRMADESGAGVEGEAGQGGGVATHAGRAFGQAILYSLLGGVVQAISRTSPIFGSSSGLSGATYGNAQAQRPTFHIEPGTSFDIVTYRDLLLLPYGGRS